MKLRNGLHHPARIHVFPVLGAEDPPGFGVQQLFYQAVQIPHVKHGAAVADFGETGHFQSKAPELLIGPLAALAVNHGGPEQGYPEAIVFQG